MNEFRRDCMRIMMLKGFGLFWHSSSLPKKDLIIGDNDRVEGREVPALVLHHKQDAGAKHLHMSRLAVRHCSHFPNGQETAAS